MKCALLLIQLSVSFFTSAQDTCWKVTPEKNEVFYGSLFTAFSNHYPDLAIVKVDFDSSCMHYVSGINVLRAYCKQKYTLSDTAVIKFTEKFLKEETKIPLNDTLLISKIDTQFYNFKFFSDDSIQAFRQLGVKRFLIKHYTGTFLQGNSIPPALIAYLYENRLFWEVGTGRLSDFILRNLEMSCNIKWTQAERRFIEIN